MSKALCHKKGVKTKKIGDISETILGTFPKIIEFEVSTPFWINTPLQDWKTKRIDGGKNIKVEGLDWWFAYNSIKHDEVGSITDATLENAIIAFPTGICKMYRKTLLLFYRWIRSCCKIKRCTKFIFISIAKTRGNRG